LNTLDEMEDDILKLQLFKLTVAGALAVTSLTACMDNRQGAGTNDVRQNNIRPYGLTQNQMDMNRWDNRRGNNYTSMHNNTRMQMSQNIANHIAAMPEVKSANVLLTDKNAYVAVVLHDNATQTNRGAGTTGAAPLGTTGIGLPGTRSGVGIGGGLAGTSDGMTGGTATGSRDGMMGGTATGRTDGMFGTTRTNTSDHGVSLHVKDRIARKVMSIQPNVRNVFISANPDFVDRMNGYAQRFRNGQPIRGLILEFNTTVERIFPQRATTNRTNISPPGPGVRGAVR
jgi:hypothetical protein